MNKNYNSLIEYLEKNNCKIITTLEQYTNCKEKVKRIDIISSCGHESKNVYTNVLKNRGTGVLCRNCVHDKFKLNNKNNSSHNTMVTESNAIKEITSNLNKILIKKTDEGCLSDLCIKPNNVKEDKWLPIQLKSTNKFYKDFYSFQYKKNHYKDNIIFFMYLGENKKLWIIDNEIINNQIKVSIGSKKVSKYSKYEVNLSNLDNKLREIYNNFENYHKQFNEINIPISKQQQTEQTHKKNREKKIDFIKFSYPDENQIVYDFKINNFKIQEKVSTKPKTKNNFVVALHKNGGTTNKVRNLIGYAKGDNDFYWINLPNFDYFFVIPEKILIEKDVIARPNNKKGSITIPHNLTEKHWLFEHRFSYLEPDRPKLLKLFNL